MRNENKILIAIIWTSIWMLSISAFGTGVEELKGWSAKTVPVRYSSVNVADIDGDGEREIAIIGWDGDLYLLDRYGDIRPGFPINISEGTSTGETLTPTIADINNDGNLDIICASVTGSIIAVDGYGRTLSGWSLDLGNDKLTSPPIVQDITGYPGLEIFTASAAGTIYGLHFDGTKISGWQVETNSANPQIAIGDVDGDNTADIVVTASSKIFVYDYRGQLLEGWPQSIDATITSPPVIADLDGDNQQSIFFGASDGYAYSYDAYGNLRNGWSTHISSRPITAPPAIANIDGTGGLEVIFIASSAHLDETSIGLLSDDGRMLRGFPKTVDFATATAPITFDVEGDGLAEIVLATLDGTIVCIDKDGNELTQYRTKTFNGEITATPTATDFDGDGDTDLVIATQDGVISILDYDAPFSRNSAPWATYQGDSWRSGKYHRDTKRSDIDFKVRTKNRQITVTWNTSPSADRKRWELLRGDKNTPQAKRYLEVAKIEQSLDGDYEYVDDKVAYGTLYYYQLKEYLTDGTVITYGPKTIKTQNAPSLGVTKTKFLKLFPNPFNDKATITYQVAEEDIGEIHLSVYDLSGKVIRQLSKGVDSEGEYTFSWDGHDKSGNEAPSGVYVLELRTEEKRVATKNLVLMR